MAKGTIFLTGTTQFSLTTPEYTNSGGATVSGINYTIALPAGTEIVAAKDQNDDAVNVAANVVGPVSIAAGATIQLHITIGISNLSLATCPLEFFGSFQDADACVLAGTKLHSYYKDCISCNNIDTCISAGSAQALRVETADYTVQTTDGVILADSGANTITLTASPLADQENTIKNIDGATLTISGNGNNIDGGASYSMTSLDESITVKWDSANTEWRVIAKSLATGKDVFTPTAEFATAGDVSFTYNTANGIGYQIGNLYYFHIDLDIDTNAYTTASGAFTINGIPVTPVADVSANISNIGNMVLAGGETPYAEVDTNADVIIGVTTTGAAAAAADENHFPASISNITIRVSGFFEI